MISFEHTIKDEVGIHARPAGLLAKAAKEWKSEIVLEKNGKSVNVTRLMQLMSMGIKCSDTVKVTVSGEDEAEAAQAMKKFFRENL